jgi:hypothetical protein
MGACCEAHLLTKINDYIERARDGQVTVQKIPVIIGRHLEETTQKCDYCNARAMYTVSYFSK